MAVILKYTKAQYDAKITELEDYLAQLKEHHSNLTNYKEQLKEFWDDVNSEKTVEALFSMLRQVQNSIDRTNDLLTFYRKAVTDLAGTSSSVDSTLSDALSIISGLGI